MRARTGRDPASSIPPVSIEPELTSAPVAEELLAVARDTGRLVDDRGAGLCVSRLTSVDLPTFGKPTMATVPAIRRRGDAVAHRGGTPSGPAEARASRPSQSHRRSDLGLHESRCLPVSLAALRHAVEGHRLAPRDRDGLEAAGPPACVPWIATGTTGTSSCRATIAAPACTGPGTPERCRVPSTKRPSAWPSRDDLTHRPHRLTVGLAAPDGEAAERADQRAEPRRAVRLDLRHVVDRCAGSRRRAPPGRASEKWLRRDDDAALERDTLLAVDLEPRRRLRRSVPNVGRPIAHVTSAASSRCTLRDERRRSARRPRRGVSSRRVDLDRVGGAVRVDGVALVAAPELVGELARPDAVPLGLPARPRAPPDRRRARP